MGRRLGVKACPDIAIDPEGPRLWATGMVRKADTTESASVSSVGLLTIGSSVDVRAFPASAMEIKSPRSSAVDGMREVGIAEFASVSNVEMLLSAAPSLGGLASVVVD